MQKGKACIIFFSGMQLNIVLIDNGFLNFFVSGKSGKYVT